MDSSRFWIVGGEYQDISFTDLVPGTARVLGPFPDETVAERAWRQVSEEYRRDCLFRFTIAAEGGRAGRSEASRGAVKSGSP